MPFQMDNFNIKISVDKLDIFDRFLFEKFQSTQIKIKKLMSIDRTSTHQIKWRHLLSDFTHSSALDKTKKRTLTLLLLNYVKKIDVRDI